MMVCVKNYLGNELLKIKIRLNPRLRESESVRSASLSTIISDNLQSISQATNPELQQEFLGSTLYIPRKRKQFYR